jgi:hypothetical protein
MQPVSGTTTPARVMGDHAATTRQAFIAGGIPRELTREKVAGVLEAAGFARHVPPRKRKRDPDPADGFRVVSESEADDGAVLAVWMTNREWRATPSPGQRAESRCMAEQYLQALRNAGFRAELAGVGWDYARVLPSSVQHEEGSQ